MRRRPDRLPLRHAPNGSRRCVFESCATSRHAYFPRAYLRLIFLGFWLSHIMRFVIFFLLVFGSCLLIYFPGLYPPGGPTAVAPTSSSHAHTRSRCSANVGGIASDTPLADVRRDSFAALSLVFVGALHAPFLFHVCQLALPSLSSSSPA